VTEELTLRRVTPDDVETLVQMRYAMQVELEEWREGIDPADLLEANREYFRKQLSGFHFSAFFVQYGGDVVATGGLVVYDNPPGPSNPSGTEGYIMNMYTKPAWRGHGIAKLILNQLVAHARAEGAGRVWLRSSDQGRRVYERFGFQQRDTYMQMFIWEKKA